jgi:RecA-family ATPase
MLRNLVRLAVVLLVGHALYRFVPVYVHYHQFKDAVAEVALFAKDRNESDLVDRVMTLAEQYQIPIDREAVQVTRDKQFTYINVSYEEQIEWLPAYTRPMPFTIAVEGWHVRPPTGVDPLR